MGEAGEVDFGAFEALLDWHAEQGSDGVVVAGTTGEAATLLASEIEELLRRAVRRLGGRVPVIAGTGTPSTAITIERTRRACEVGVDGVLMVTPYYNRPGQAGLLQHFWAAAEASSVPVLLYNVPSRTACDLLPDTLEQLAEHPRIVGIKDATGSIVRAREILERCGDDFLLFSGDDATCREWLLAGAQGVISVTANIAPRLMRELAEAALEGDAPRAAELDRPLAELHRALFVESNPIPVKWALARLGLIPPGIRLPLTPLGSAGQPAVLRAMEQAGIV
ncbi:MAG: 4-hydroxy-tetrahydrodipicolinate synthase [Steroidobacteraceae bacterium]|nr:4-hydroxy-tetrahydrodipicolinate synthase [Steroidobacteraceae bacterium]